MDKEQALLILKAYRPGAEADDAEIATALELAAQDPELGKWFADEQAFDRAIAAHLDAIPEPLGLKTRLLANAPSQTSPGSPAQWSWIVKLAGMAALLFLLVQVVSVFHPAAAPTALVGDYASEMVSFIRITPRLEMMSDDLGKIESWLDKKKTTPMQVPAHLAALEPIGCRILSFRGQNVTLICFQRKEDGLAHLFVVNRAAMPQMKPGAKTVISQEGEWATASWAEKDSVYMVTVQGGPEAVERYLPHA